MFLDRKCYPTHWTIMNIARMTSEIKLIMWKCYQAVWIGHVKRLFLDLFKSKFVIDEENSYILIIKTNEMHYF